MGKTGLKVSEICLGTMTFGVQCDEKTSFGILDKAAAAGLDFLDTADAYPVPMKLATSGITEQILGRWLKGKRDRFVVATKCFFPMGEGPRDRGNSRRHIVGSIEASLSRLQTDYIDLYQVHAFDPETPLEETLRALDDLVRQGKARYVGCSNFSGWQIADAAWTARTHGLARFVSAQNHYNLLERGVEAEVAPACDAFGLSLLPYFPLASGLLTGKYRRGEKAPDGTRLGAGRFGSQYLTERNFDRVEKLDAFARDAGHALLELAISWLASQPAIASVIAGATSPEQVEQNVRAAGWKLAPDEIAKARELAG